jgi:hypothetical protein
MPGDRAKALERLIYLRRRAAQILAIPAALHNAQKPCAACAQPLMNGGKKA